MEQKLPQVALGQPQSVVMATAFFENDMLHLEEVFVPPMNSNTMSSKPSSDETDEEKGGRPEKPDDEKSDKTIKNIESEG